MRELTKTELETLTKNWDADAKEFKTYIEENIKAINKINFVDSLSIDQSSGDLIDTKEWVINELKQLKFGVGETNYREDLKFDTEEIQAYVLSEFLDYDEFGGLLNDERVMLEQECRNMIDDAISKLTTHREQMALVEDYLRKVGLLKIKEIKVYLSLELAELRYEYNQRVKVGCSGQDPFFEYIIEEGQTDALEPYIEISKHETLSGQTERFDLAWDVSSVN